MFMYSKSGLFHIQKCSNHVEKNKGNIKVDNNGFVLAFSYSTFAMFRSDGGGKKNNRKGHVKIQRTF